MAAYAKLSMQGTEQGTYGGFIMIMRGRMAQYIYPLMVNNQLVGGFNGDLMVTNPLAMEY